MYTPEINNNINPKKAIYGMVKKELIINNRIFKIFIE